MAKLHETDGETTHGSKCEDTIATSGIKVLGINRSKFSYECLRPWYPRKQGVQKTEDRNEVCDEQSEYDIRVSSHVTAADIDSDELFGSGKSLRVESGKHSCEITDPEVIKEQCQQCLDQNAASIRLQPCQIEKFTSQQNNPEATSEIKLSEVIKSVHSDERSHCQSMSIRPCFQYSVVIGGGEMLHAFLRCLHAGHLERHCGIILDQRALGKIVQHNGFFRRDSEYDEIRLLGEGGYGAVYQCRTLVQRGRSLKEFQFVLKKMNAKRFNEEEVLVPLFHSQSCKQILDLYGVIKDGDTIMMLMEYAEGGTFYDMYNSVQDWSQSFALLMVSLENLLLGLRYLHTAGLCHFDIKARNIVFRRRDDPSSVAFIDWGSVKYLESRNTCFKDGTKRFYPPERLVRVNTEHLMAHDIFTLGCTLFSTLQGTYLLQEYFKRHVTSWHEIGELLLRDENPIRLEMNKIDQSHHWLCPAAVDLLYALVRSHPEERVSAGDALKHRLFQDPHCFNRLDCTFGQTVQVAGGFWENVSSTTERLSILEGCTEYVKVTVTLESTLLLVCFVPKGTTLREFIKDRNFLQVKPYTEDKDGFCLLEAATKRNVWTFNKDTDLVLVFV